MRSVLLWILFLAIVLATDGQSLRVSWVKTETSDTIELQQGDYVRFAYKGYRLQPEQVTGRVLAVGADSTLLLQTRKFFLLNGEQRVVHLTDVTGFRKFNRNRELWRLSYFVLITGGDLLLFQALGNLSDVLRFAVSGVSGLVIVGGDRLLFPGRIRNHVKDGWQYHISSR